MKTTLNEIDRKIKDGGLVATEKKKNIINDAMGDLSNRSREVLDLRFNLSGKYDAPKSFDGIGDIYGVTRERIRQIEAKAIRSLRHPSRMRKLELVYGFATDEEVEERIKIANQKKLAREKAIEEMKMGEYRKGDLINVDELEVSVRIANCLNRANITNIGELLRKKPENLLKYNGFGKKSHRELKGQLLRMGFNPEVL